MNPQFLAPFTHVCPRGARWISLALWALGLSVLMAFVFAPGARAVTVENVKLKGSHGYKLKVHASSYQSCGCKQRFSLTATKHGHGVRRTGYYLVRGRDGRHLVGDFGKRGVVNVRFHPKTTRPVDHCGGSTTKTQVGVWTGKIKFRGERGYTAASAHRARGSFSRVHRPWECHAANGGDVTGGQLFGEGRVGQGLAYFSADNQSSDSIPDIRAGMSARKNGVWSDRSVEIKKAPSSVFTVASDRASAHLAPPSPFAGSADFVRGTAPEPDDWTGSLTVHLPGEKSATPLTGDGFHVQLVPVS